MVTAGYSANHRAQHKHDSSTTEQHAPTKPNGGAPTMNRPTTRTAHEGWAGARRPWMLAFAGILASMAVVVHVGLDVGTASAHVAPIEASCETGLQITLKAYDPAGINLLRVWIDGNELASTTFGSSASTAFPFGDLFVSHTYRVTVSAWDDPIGEHGWSFDTGTLTIPVCAETSTTAVATTAPAVAGATTLPATTIPATTTPATTTPATGPVSSAVVTAPQATPGPTITVIVAQAGVTGPPQTAASIVTAVSGTLPVTGGNDLGPAVALAALLAGAVLVLGARRPA